MTLDWSFTLAALVALGLAANWVALTEARRESLTDWVGRIGRGFITVCLVVPYLALVVILIAWGMRFVLIGK